MDDTHALTEAVYYILLSLYSPKHGYGIMQQTQQLSDGKVRLAAGTLYGALSNLCVKGWVEAVPGGDEERRKQYRLTAAGEAVLRGELQRLRRLVANGEEILEVENND